MLLDYTLVLGLDAKHLDQFRMVRETWWRHKPSLWRVPWVIFYDKEQIDSKEIRLAVCHENLVTVPWPINDLKYKGIEEGKWGSSQRYKMLAGFVHVSAAVVRTTYWLKVDVDSVAMGMDDWIQDEWFEDEPTIVCHPWGYTKPPDQMMRLDRWVEENKEKLRVLSEKEPLNLAPKPGAELIKHKRIISWCSFWKTSFTRVASYLASVTCGSGMLPVSSQDGYLWYCAKRLKLGIVRPNMKDHGWAHRSSMKGIQGAVLESLEGDQDGKK